MSDVMDPCGHISPCGCLRERDEMQEYDFGSDDAAMLRQFKETTARWDEVTEQTDQRIKQLQSSQKMSEFFNTDTIVGEVKVKPKANPMDFDRQEMKKRELSKLEKELQKAERQLEKLTGKVDKPEAPEWAEQDTAINMVIRHVGFSWYSAWVTSIGNEHKRTVKFYARNPYNAYLLARKWATKGAKGYFLSSNIRFENM